MCQKLPWLEACRAILGITIGGHALSYLRNALNIVNN
jgi:hypothetical protein